MLPISGQTGGPNGLTFCVDAHGWLGVFQAKRIEFFFSQTFFFHGQRRANQFLLITQFHCLGEGQIFLSRNLFFGSQNRTLFSISKVCKLMQDLNKEYRRNNLNIQNFEMLFLT